MCLFFLVIFQYTERLEQKNLVIIFFFRPEIHQAVSLRFWYLQMMFEEALLEDFFLFDESSFAISRYLVCNSSQCGWDLEEVSL